MGGARARLGPRGLCSLVAASTAACLAFAACSHGWDAYDPRLGETPDGSVDPPPDAGDPPDGDASTDPPDADAAPDAQPDADAGDTHVTEGLVVLYTFEEGQGAVVHDVAGTGAPLDLDIADPAAVTWIPGALSVDAATIIESPGPATKIIDACMAANAITLEVWFRPALLDQGGPARLITNSANISERNFQLGQELASFYQARLRTTLSTVNGSPFLTTPVDGGDVALELTHLVFTRDVAGERYVYVNGVQRGTDSVAGDFSTWDTTHRLALANEFTTFDRIWLGELHRAAVYARALDPAEVAQNHAAGP